MNVTYLDQHVIQSMISGILSTILMDGQITCLSLLSLVFLVCCTLFHYTRFISVRFRSYFQCCTYFYKGGRTYFAAATLMNPRRFCDTAAMYALFRATDDIVDDENDNEEEKHNKLSLFENNFWSCLRKGVGSEELHPILPAVIETVKRRKYSVNLFKRFFQSMKMDEGEHRCQTEQETYNYMEGSAAVIGEFMLPILQPDYHLREHLTPYAKDMGRAFQMTNFIRDIAEDLDLGRQYIPEDVCKRHNVVLSSKDHQQSGFASMMEELFEYTDKFYASADIGIAGLNKEVGHVIRVARKVYHAIHMEIREKHYDVFHGKLKVSFAKKIRIAAKEIPLLQLLRIVVLEFFALVVFNATWLCVLAWACFATSFHIKSPTYLQFHIIFTFPVFVGMFPPKRVLRDACILGCIAFTYTTPWDNLLVYMDGWSYFEDRVLFVIGYVPVEEYCFFVIETFIVCGIFTKMANDRPLKSVPKSSPRTPILITGLTAILVGAWLSTIHFYLGSILVWCAPPITFQLWYRIEVIAVHKWLVVKCVVVSTLYLCIIDHWGIAHGTWKIQDTMFDAYEGLPIEEALFFIVTSIMCSQGFLLSLCLLTEFVDSVKKIKFN